MTTLLLLIIYLAFISLGLPDALLGTAWPVMQLELDLPMEVAGVLSMTITSGTIISSLASGRLLKRYGTGKVTFISVLMTAAALLGFYLAPSLIWLIICAIPLGLGAGAVDTGLNDYVAINYEARHMSWLHSFWGVGASLSPIIMSQFILQGHAWREGYLTISIIQFALVAILFLSIPLWSKVAATEESQLNQAIEAEATASKTATKPLQVKGVKYALLTFLFYCGIEAGVGLWGSSFLVNIKNFDPAIAARWVSFYYGGITIGRFITGFITFKMSNKALIRTGQMTALIGTILLFLPLPQIFLMSSFVIIGLGLAPIFPCMIHETPANFGKQHSQVLIGYQMAAAYTGTTFVPPLIGLFAGQLTIAIFPPIAILLVAGMLFSSEKLNQINSVKSKQLSM
ncbi:MFS transporter [Amphibacillus xylanus]|uniref:Major facilitator superfamily transporter n=1 Tax=Amphibacillus xylanus (strain ATCC 51415 / DSM 6626 / JCM 7361 / LMG 17667 / NBRC 15112 / Ep01) TaxID=698758 RepID=K0J4I4_AMPXN|nr:MFS transporter [Amphibacillus xylanus]BAM48202.1 major facilitator superfamily transporter [Amphibacillus xylanus NBRC 15112]